MAVSEAHDISDSVFYESRDLFRSLRLGGIARKIRRVATGAGRERAAETNLEQRSYSPSKLLTEIAPNGNVWQASPMHAREACTCPTGYAQRKLGVRPM